MSLKTNKAARLNKVMMASTMFLGVVVIGCVILFMSYAFDKQGTQTENTPDALTNGDSLVIEVEDSLFAEEL